MNEGQHSSRTIISSCRVSTDASVSTPMATAQTRTENGERGPPCIDKWIKMRAPGSDLALTRAVPGCSSRGGALFHSLPPHPHSVSTIMDLGLGDVVDDEECHVPSATASAESMAASASADKQREEGRRARGARDRQQQQQRQHEHAFDAHKKETLLQLEGVSTYVCRGVRVYACAAVHRPPHNVVLAPFQV